MKTKYNPITNDSVASYLDKLVNKIFKLLPLKEEENDTLEKYHRSLMLELTGFGEVFDSEKGNDYVTLVCTLEGLLFVVDLHEYKSEVFKCINLAKKLK